MKFEHTETPEGRHYLFFKEDSGQEVRFWIESDEVEYVTIGDNEYELSVDSPVIDAIYIMNFRNHVCLRRIVSLANTEWPEHKRQLAEDAEVDTDFINMSAGK